MSENELLPSTRAAESEALRRLEDALREPSPEAWVDVSRFWRLSLRPEVRMAIAITALLACDREDRRDVVPMLKPNDPFDGMTAPDPFEEDAT